MPTADHSPCDHRRCRSRFLNAQARAARFASDAAFDYRPAPVVTGHERPVGARDDRPDGGNNVVARNQSSSIGAGDNEAARRLFDPIVYGSLKFSLCAGNSDAGVADCVAAHVHAFEVRP